jgi:hypothetical protein
MMVSKKFKIWGQTKPRLRGKREARGVISMEKFLFILAFFALYTSFALGSVIDDGVEPAQTADQSA